MGLACEFGIRVLWFWHHGLKHPLSGDARVLHSVRSMKRLSVAIFLVFLLSGCEDPLYDLLDLLSGVRTEQVVLLDQPMTITEREIIILSNAVKTVGDSSSVCLVLSGDVEGADSESAFSRLVNGASVIVIAASETGEKNEFSRVSKSWALKGTIARSKEVSLCLLSPCGEDVPIGSEFTSLEILSSKKLDVIGVYWESTNRWD